MTTTEMTVKKRIMRLRRGEVLPGYKKTEVGVIPEGWKKELLGSLLQEPPKNGISPKSEVHEGGRPILRINAVSSSPTRFVDLTAIKLVDVSEEEADPYILRFNDVFMVRYNGDLNRVGKPAIFKEREFCKTVFPDKLIRLRPEHNKLIPDFLIYILSNRNVREQIEELGKTTAGNIGISGSNVKSLKIPLPPLPEQHRIAEILSAWDEALEKLDTLLEKKRELKRGLMQVLLSGKKRFPEFDSGKYKKTELGILPRDWETAELHNLISPVVREVPKPDKPYWALSIRSHGKGTFHRFVEKPDKVYMETLFSVKPNDLIVNITFAWEHAIAIAKQEDDGKLVSHRFPTYIVNEALLNLGFLRAIILQPTFRKKLELISPGGAGRNRVLNKKSFMKIKVPVPPLEEQRRIADCLSTLGREMELLLTGKVRVNVTDKEDHHDHA